MDLYQCWGAVSLSTFSLINEDHILVTSLFSFSVSSSCPCFLFFFVSFFFLSFGVKTEKLKNKFIFLILWGNKTLR